ncbi:MAG: transposase [Polyangiaceae bacterium]|nr:transposase [Polyangiaceae bacterium]
MTAFKRSQAKYVRKPYKTGNWPEYEAGLRQRGSLAVWISEDELKGWGPRKRGQRKPGGQEQYSNHAIETALTVGTVFHLGLRQTEAFLRSLFSVLNLDCRAPDVTTISRRARKLGRLSICRPAGKTPVHILIDSTGLSIHVGTLRKPPKNTESHTADRSPRVLIPPKKNAQVKPEVAALRKRNRNIRSRARLGKREWHTRSGCSRRSIVENTAYRYETIIGAAMRSRTLQGQRVEARVGCQILNTMAGPGMPEGHRVD